MYTRSFEAMSSNDSLSLKSERIRLETVRRSESEDLEFTDERNVRCNVVKFPAGSDGFIFDG